MKMTHVMWSTYCHIYLIYKAGKANRLKELLRKAILNSLIHLLYNAAYGKLIEPQSAIFVLL